MYSITSQGTNGSYQCRQHRCTYRRRCSWSKPTSTIRQTHYNTASSMLAKSYSLEARSYVALPQNSAHTVSRTTEQMQAYTGKMKVLFCCSYLGIFGGFTKPAQFESSSFLYCRNVKSLQTKARPSLTTDVKFQLIMTHL